MRRLDRGAGSGRWYAQSRPSAGRSSSHFDELERLGHPGSLSLVAFLLQRGPQNLHLAVACREIPDGFDAAGAMVEGHAETLDAEDLRFSLADVARFFDLGLSRRALSEEMSRSAGWPFALRVSRNSAERRTEGRGGLASDLARNWIETRLFAGLDLADRDFVLDLSLFGWLDARAAGRSPAARQRDAPPGGHGGAGRAARTGERRHGGQLQAASVGEGALRQTTVSGSSGAFPHHPSAYRRSHRETRRSRPGHAPRRRGRRSGSCGRNPRAGGRRAPLDPTWGCAVAAGGPAIDRGRHRETATAQAGALRRPYAVGSSP